MRAFLIIAGYAALLLALGTGAMAAYSWLHSQTVVVSLHSPAPGRECAVANSPKGVGIYCWEIKQ